MFSAFYIEQNADLKNQNSIIIFKSPNKLILQSERERNNDEQLIEDYMISIPRPHTHKCRQLIPWHHFCPIFFKQKKKRNTYDLILFSGTETVPSSLLFTFFCSPPNDCTTTEQTNMNI